MRKVIIIALGLLTLCAVPCPAEAHVPPAKAAPAGPRWEYKTLSREQIADFAGKDFAAGLNKLGDEGWELVAVVPGQAPGNPRGNAESNARPRPSEYYFKRPRGQTAAEGGKVAASKAEARNEDWQIVKLKVMSAVEFARTADALFGGKAGGGPRLVAEPLTNSVLALGSPRQIEELRRLMVALDVPDAGPAAAEEVVRKEILHLKYAKVTDMIKLLQDVYGQGGTRPFRMGADERTNSLVLSGPLKALDEVRRLLTELDVAAAKDGGDRKTP